MVLVPVNMEMLQRHQIFSEAEIRSRYEITMENYVRTVRIEALTMRDMARKEILPAVESYVSALAATTAAKKAADSALACGYETKLLKKLASLVDTIDGRTEALETALVKLETVNGITEEAFAIRYHMGFSGTEDPGNVGRALEMFPLAYAVCCADMEAAFLMEGKLAGETK